MAGQLFLTQIGLELELELAGRARDLSLQPGCDLIFQIV